MEKGFRFSFGPWNIHEGADPFGPPVRPTMAFSKKLETLKELGFDAMQFHDDDAVDVTLPYPEMMRKVGELKKVLDDNGLAAEFVAPRIWEDPRTVDGVITANDSACREYALERGKKSVDIAHALGTDRLVLWPAREGTYIRESKDPVVSIQRFIDWVNAMLAHSPTIRILGEMKPNEPMDMAYLPTTGHFLALSYRTADPNRVGVLIESAHCILAGLDPSEEMGTAIAHGKLWGVHLNDQNGLKFDEDKAFGTVDLRRAFNQVYVLRKNGYGKNGEYVGLDVKAMRTQPFELSTRHLANSKAIFLKLVDVVDRVDEARKFAFISARDYEGLEMYIVDLLMGAS